MNRSPEVCSKNRISSVILNKNVADAIIILAQRVLRKAYFEFYGKSVKSLSEIEKDLVQVGCNELKTLIESDHFKLNEEDLSHLESIVVVVATQQCYKLNEYEDIKEIIVKKIMNKGVPELQEYLH